MSEVNNRSHIEEKGTKVPKLRDVLKDMYNETGFWFVFLVMPVTVLWFLHKIGVWCPDD